MLTLLMFAGFAAIAAVFISVLFLYRRGNQVGHFRASLVQAGDRCPCGGKVVARDGDFRGVPGLHQLPERARLPAGLAHERAPVLPVGIAPAVGGLGPAQASSGRPRLALLSEVWCTVGGWKFGTATAAPRSTPMPM